MLESRQMPVKVLLQAVNTCPVALMSVVRRDSYGTGRREYTEHCNLYEKLQ